MSNENNLIKESEYKANMLWFKSLAAPCKKEQTQKKFLHRKPKPIYKNSISRSKHLSNKGEYFKNLIILSKIHNFQPNQTVNEILIAYHEHIIQGRQLSETQFVKRTKALLQNRKQVELDEEKIKSKIGVNLYKNNFSKFLELRKDQQKSEAQIIEEAIQTIFKTIESDMGVISVITKQDDQRQGKFRSGKKLKKEDDGLAESIGFKCNSKTKSKLVYLSKELGISQNALAVRSVDWIFEAIENKTDLYEIIKSQIDPQILKKLQSS